MFHAQDGRHFGRGRRVLQTSVPRAGAPDHDVGDVPAGILLGQGQGAAYQQDETDQHELFHAFLQNG
jgi:hypothetical protein